MTALLLPFWVQILNVNIKSGQRERERKIIIYEEARARPTRYRGTRPDCNTTHTVQQALSMLTDTIDRQTRKTQVPRTARPHYLHLTRVIRNQPLLYIHLPLNLGISYSLLCPYHRMIKYKKYNDRRFRSK